MFDEFFLGAYWKVRKLTMREYIDAVRHYLTELQSLQPLFTSLSCQEQAGGSVPRLERELENLEELMLQRSYHKSRRYTNPRPDGGPSLDSECGTGFLIHFSSGQPESEGGLQVTITAGASSPWINNAVSIVFPRSQHPEFFEYDFVKRLMVATVQCWQPQWAVVTSHPFRERVMGKGAKFHIGWLNYFSNPVVKRLLPAGVEHEPVEQGVLLTTVREPPSPQVEEHVQTALLIREAIQVPGLIE